MSTDIPPQGGELIATQSKAIARRQGSVAGIDPQTMRNWIRSGRWQQLQRGVYATFSGEPTRETVLWGALLRAGPGAVLSHQTAAERHGLIDEPSPLITITVPVSRHPAQAKIQGIVIHRSDAILRTRHPAMLPPCTRVEDTVLDLIQIASSFDDAYAWICRAIGRRRTTADRIRLAMDSRKKMRLAGHPYAQVRNPRCRRSSLPDGRRYRHGTALARLARHPALLLPLQMRD